MIESPKHTGSCLCGAVRYEVTGPMRDVVACHCNQCRKTSGHHFAATNVKTADFRLTEDRGLKWYRSSDVAQRGFCVECGANILWKRDAAENISITAGTLDGETGLKMVRHIFCDDAGDYYEIKDGLPAFGQYD